MNLIILFLLIAQQQWTPTLTEALSMNSNIGQSKIRQDNQQEQQWTPTLTDALSMNSNIGQSQIRQDNQQQQQQSMYLYYHLIYQIFFFI